MFSMPLGDSQSVEGKDDDHPIPLLETTRFEFECLLEFLYDG